MGYNLFLDDFRTPSMAAAYVLPVEDRLQYRTEVWDVVKSYEEFGAHIMKYGLPAKVSFDHDLADEHYNPDTWVEGYEYKEKTGYECAKWLIDYCIVEEVKLPLFYSHSMNPIGKERILSLLKNYKEHETNSAR